MTSWESKKGTFTTRSNDKADRRVPHRSLGVRQGESWTNPRLPSLQSLSDVTPKLLLVGSQTHFAGTVSMKYSARLVEFGRVGCIWISCGCKRRAGLWMGVRISFVSHLGSSPYVVCPGIIYPTTLWIVLVIFKVCIMITKRTIGQTASYLQKFLNTKVFSTE